MNFKLNKTAKLWKFIVPSILGAILFLVPFPLPNSDGEITITVLFGHINSFVKSATFGDLKLYDAILWIGFGLMIVSILLSVGLFIINKANKNTSSNIYRFSQTKFAKVFNTGIAGLIIRVVGAVMYLVILLTAFAGTLDMSEVPVLKYFFHEYTGILIVESFIGSVIVTFILGNLFLPLLLEFGLLEYAGRLFEKVTYKLFRIPGRATIDALTSFVGDGTLGIVVTDEQYAKGHYSRREAVLIATGFSVVGIAFTTLVAGELGFLDGANFIVFYGTIIVTSLIIALIIPRTPIMRLYKDEYYNGIKATEELGEIANATPIEIAKYKANHSMENIKEIYKEVGYKILGILFTWIPLIVFVGTTALVLAEFSTELFNMEENIFYILSVPFRPLLWLLQIPDANDVAAGILVSITDMYIPTLFIGGSEYMLSKFVVGTMSFITIIFFAESGVVLMKSKMKVSFWQLLMFFMVRVIIALPIVALIGHIAGKVLGW